MAILLFAPPVKKYIGIVLDPLSQKAKTTQIVFVSKQKKKLEPLKHIF